MSGEPLVALHGEAMARLVRAAAKIADADLGRYAVISGVAVSARLGQAHRATADIDAVVDDLAPPPAIETLLHVPGARPDPTGAHRVLIDDIKVEIQGTEPFATAGLDKRAGDAWDLYRMLLDLDRDATVRHELASIPTPLRNVITEATERILVERAIRTVSWLKAGDERMAIVTAEELRALALPVLAALRVN